VLPQVFAELLLSVGLLCCSLQQMRVLSCGGGQQHPWVWQQMAAGCCWPCVVLQPLLPCHPRPVLELLLKPLALVAVLSAEARPLMALQQLQQLLQPRVQLLARQLW